MTERIEFVCPHCLRPCKVPPELAGKQGRCPGCGKYLEVPRVSPSIRARRSSLDDDPPDTQRRRQRAPTRAHRAATRAHRIPTEPRRAARVPTEPLQTARVPSATRPAIEVPDVDDPETPGPPRLSWWVIVGAVLSVLLPVIGALISVRALKVARLNGGRGERIAWCSIGIAIAIMVGNVLVILSRPPPPPIKDRPQTSPPR